LGKASALIFCILVVFSQLGFKAEALAPVQASDPASDPPSISLTLSRSTVYFQGYPLSNDDGTLYPFDAANVTAQASADISYGWRDTVENLSYYYSLYKVWLKWSYDSRKLYLNTSAARIWNEGGKRLLRNSTIFYVISYAPIVLTVQATFYAEYYYRVVNDTDGSIVDDGYTTFYTSRSLQLQVVSVEETLKFCKFKTVAYLNLSKPGPWEYSMNYILMVKPEAYAPGIFPQPINRRIVVNNLTSYTIAYNVTSKFDCFLQKDFSEYVSWNITGVNYSFPKYFPLYTNRVQKIGFTIASEGLNMLLTRSCDNITSYFTFYYSFPPQHLPKKVLEHLKTLPPPPSNFNTTITVFKANYTHNIWYKVPLGTGSLTLSPFPLGYSGKIAVIAYDRSGRVDENVDVKVSVDTLGGENRTYVAPGVGPVTFPVKVYLREKVGEYVRQVTGDDSMVSEALKDVPDSYAKPYSGSGRGSLTAEIFSFAGALTYAYSMEKVSLMGSTVQAPKPAYTYNIIVEASGRGRNVKLEFADPLDDVIYSPSTAYVYMNFDGFDFGLNVVENQTHTILYLNFPKECGGIVLVNITDGVYSESIPLGGKPNYTPLAGVYGYVGSLTLAYPRGHWKGAVEVTAVNEWGIQGKEWRSLSTPPTTQPPPAQEEGDWIKWATILAIFSAGAYVLLKKAREHEWF